MKKFKKNNPIHINEQYISSLLKQFQRGKPEVFEKIFKSYEPYLFNMAKTLLDTPEEIEEAVQDTFIQAWRSLKDFRQEASLGTWLCRIVINNAKSRYLRQKRRNAVFKSFDNAYLLRKISVRYSGDPFENDRFSGTDSCLLRRAVYSVIEKFPVKRRRIFIWRYVEELSYKEISEKSGYPIGTIKSQISRGKQQLSRAVRKYRRCSLSPLRTDGFQASISRCEGFFSDR